MVSCEPPPAEPAVAALLRRLDACYFDHADRIVLDPWVRDVAQYSTHGEVAAGALANLANHYFFLGEFTKSRTYVDRAEALFARTPLTRDSLNMRWLIFNVRGFLAATATQSEKAIREANEHNMAGMRFAAKYQLERGVAVSAINAGWEMVRLGEPVDALLLMTQLLDMNTFDRRSYAHIREVTAFALASGGYYDEALSQFQIALDATEPNGYAQRSRLSIAMADCAINVGQLDIATFELETAGSVLDFIEAEQGALDLVETNRGCLDQVQSRILVRQGEIDEALAMVDKAFHVRHDWFLRRSTTALDVWLEAGKPHYAFDGTKPTHRSEFGGQLRYITLLERCAAETGRFELALKLRRQLNVERTRHAVDPNVIVRLGGPSTIQIKARQQRTQVELAQIVALAQWHDNLLDMTAHELRGPLTALQLASELLVFDVDTAAERLQTLLPMVERMRRTTQGFQSLIELVSDPTAETIEPRRIDDELSVAVESLRDAANAKKIEIRASGLDREHHAYVSRGSVVICVANLVSNAIKYSPPNSVIDIRATRVNDRIIVDVCDQGPGIARQDRAIAFDWQVRLGHKPTGNEMSHGLGLSITRTLVEAAGGTVKVLDRPDKSRGAHLRITWRAAPSR